MNISPIELKLDPRNPRFITPEENHTQEAIRIYLISQEDVIPLANSLAETNNLMPGERIVVCQEDGNWIVLEGNRRTCVCQMFLDRDLIPKDFTSKFPPSNDEIIQNISDLEVDILPSREDAKRFLATRHIIRPREWSTIAKMRFCYEDYNEGRSIDEIKLRTGLDYGVITKFINHYKILIRGRNQNWTDEERIKIDLLSIKPDKLLRLFDTAETSNRLKLYYDQDHNLMSSIISDDDLSSIILIWTRKAFIDDEINTRSVFGTYSPDGKSKGACKYIEHILGNYPFQSFQVSDGSKSSAEADLKSEYASANEASDDGRNDSNHSTNNTDNPNNSTTDSKKDSSKNKAGGPNVSSFFSTLSWAAVDTNNSKNTGIIAVCKEIYKISHDIKFVTLYPICTAFIIRALIEHSLKYHAKNNKNWAQIMKNYKQGKNKKENDPNLGFIIDQYNKNNATYLSDNNIRKVFNVVFNVNKQTDKLNLVIHSPESFRLTPGSLLAIPDEGLLEIINYLLS